MVGLTCAFLDGGQGAEHVGLPFEKADGIGHFKRFQETGAGGAGVIGIEGVEEGEFRIGGDLAFDVADALGEFEGAHEMVSCGFQRSGRVFLFQGDDVDFAQDILGFDLLLEATPFLALFEGFVGQFPGLVQIGRRLEGGDPGEAAQGIDCGFPIAVGIENCLI